LPSPRVAGLPERVEGQRTRERVREREKEKEKESERERGGEEKGE